MIMPTVSFSKELSSIGSDFQAGQKQLPCRVSSDCDEHSLHSTITASDIDAIGCNFTEGRFCKLSAKSVKNIPAMHADDGELPCNQGSTDKRDFPERSSISKSNSLVRQLSGQGQANRPPKQPDISVSKVNSSLLRRTCLGRRRRYLNVQFQEDANQYYNSTMRQMQKDDEDIHKHCHLDSLFSCAWYASQDYDRFRYQLQRQVHFTQFHIFLEEQKQIEQKHQEKAPIITDINNVATSKEDATNMKRQSKAWEYAKATEYLLRVATRIKCEIHDTSKLYRRYPRIQETLTRLYCCRGDHAEKESNRVSGPKANTASEDQRAAMPSQKLKTETSDHSLLCVDVGNCDQNDKEDQTRNLSDDDKDQRGKMDDEAFTLEWIGLEYYLGGGVHRSVRRESKERRYRINEVVSDIQSEYQLGLWTSDTVESELRDSCCQISQPHALFAQFLAQAQWMTTE